jgi:RNA polymerase sigma factor (sigma-70 family)
MRASGAAKESVDVSERSRRDRFLQEVVTANRPKLAAFVRRYVEDQVEAEDVLQDVFEEFVATYDLGATIERVSTWLVTVARNKIFDRFRRKRTREAHRQAAASAGGESQTSEDWARSWLRQEIVKALELLPEAQRKVFVRHELEGRTFKEIMAETGAPLGTLLARKKYAVDFLRNYLKEVYDELES